jgi:hypothetical protein
MDEPSSGSQRLFRRLSSPELFAAMARESRLWKAECPDCRADTTNVWEMGGIRYKAAGEPKRRARCPRCGQIKWLRLHWTGGDPTALGPRPSIGPFLLRMMLLTVLLPMLLVAGILLLVFKQTGLI